MPIQVPQKRPRLRSARPAAPPAGWHTAVVADAAEDGQSVAMRWTLSAEGRSWNVDQTVRGALLHAALVDLGFGGREIEAADLVGARAWIHVRTRGGRKSAEVVATAPL